MKKLFLIFAGISFSALAAINTSGTASAPISNLSCKQIRQEYRENHTKIKLAREQQNADTLGELQIQNRKLFAAHRECFKPKVTMSQ